MNNFLDLTGALIYLIFSVVVFPLTVLVYGLIFLVTATRYCKAYSRKLRKNRVRNRNQETAEEYPWNFELVLQKLHVFGYKR